MSFISALAAEAPSTFVGGNAVQSWLEVVGGISGEYASRLSKSIAVLRLSTFTLVLAEVNWDTQL